MRSILMLPLLGSLVSSTAWAEEVYLNVASQSSLFTANRLGRMVNAITLHERFNDKCDLSPLLDRRKFEEHYKELTWSLSPSDLSLVQKNYSDAQATWSAERGGVPGTECDVLGYEILDFGIGIENPREEMLSLLNAAPQGSSQYKVYAAAVAAGLYLQSFINCPDYIVSWATVDKIQSSNRDEFRVPNLLARMAALESPPDCRDIEPFARDGGVYRARRQ